ncbi:MAG TPA: hypothetical protein VGH19_21575 [Verrucomicrobiae bacterium]
MKTFCLLAVVVVGLCGCSTKHAAVISRNEALTLADVDYAPNRPSGAVRLQLPSGSTGTGHADYYTLFAQYHRGKSIVYGLGIATSPRAVDAGSSVIVNGLGALTMNAYARPPASLDKKMNYTEVFFDKDFVEQSATTGRFFTLTSERGTHEFQVPDWMFAALIESLERRLPEMRTKSFNVMEAMNRQQLQRNHVNSATDMPDDMREAILDGFVMVGMTYADVRASWGDPEMVSAEASGSEVWRYPGGRVMLENGVVTTLQADEPR